MQIRPLPPALRKKAEEELWETPSKIKTNIKIIRDWLQHQPHLQSIRPTDQWLIAFLRGSKHDIEKTKRKIELYYKLKGTSTEFFGNRDPFDKNIQEILKLGTFLPLKKTLREDSPKIILTRFVPLGPSEISLADFIKVCLMISEILLLEDDNFTVVGEEVLCDLHGIPFRFLWQWTPAMARRVVEYGVKALSIRLKGIHLLNLPFGIGGAIAIFKMFLGAKIKGRIFTPTKNALYDQIDKSTLPEEYGGTHGSLQELTDYWKEKVESYRDWFMDETAYADESKRPVSKPSGRFFGW